MREGTNTTAPALTGAVICVAIAVGIGCYFPLPHTEPISLAAQDKVQVDLTADVTISFPDASGLIWSTAEPEAMLTFPDGFPGNMRHVQDLDGMTFVDVDGKTWVPTWRAKESK